MATSIKNVAWVGTGRTGKPLLDIVAKSNKFKITLLVRKPSSTYTTIIPPSIKVVQVDFQSHTSLVSALQGIDAVVNVLTFGPASSIDLVEIALINAAIEAGVKFFIPSEWAPDSAGANVLEEQWIGRTLRPNVVIAPKRSVHNYLMARAGQGKIAYAVVFTGVIIPSSLAVGMISFDFKTKTALLPDDGIHLFPATTLTTAGAAVVAILSNALSPTVKNRFIHISDFTTSQAEILSIVEETLGGTPWTRKNVPVKGFFDQSISNIENGIYGVREFAGVLTSPFFGGGTTWKADDNEILGLGERQNLRLEVAALAKQYAANN